MAQVLGGCVSGWVWGRNLAAARMPHACLASPVHAGRAALEHPIPAADAWITRPCGIVGSTAAALQVGLQALRRMHTVRRDGAEAGTPGMEPLGPWGWLGASAPRTCSPWIFFPRARSSTGTPTSPSLVMGLQTGMASVLRGTPGTTNQRIGTFCMQGNNRIRAKVDCGICLLGVTRSSMVKGSLLGRWHLLRC